jgi:hypothetical protein
MTTSSFVFPVRYVSEGIAVQTTSRELSALGIAVRSLTPPQVGARVSMALYLPNTPVPEVAIGRVARSKSDGASDAGFWADFLVVDAQARMRISSMLADHGFRGQNRAFPRYSVKLGLRVRTSGATVEAEAMNLSRSGVFARTEQWLPTHASVEVDVFLPDGGPPASTSGLVVHRQILGAGIQFVDASDAFRERIDRFMDGLSRKKNGS